MNKAHQLITPADAGEHPKRHLLLIADDPAFLAHTTYLLAQAGHQVATARDGAEALQQIDAQTFDGRQFDLLIIDIDLPEMSGFALLRQIWDLRMSLPVLIVANFFDSARFHEAHYLGCSEIVLKSRIPEELLQYLEQLNPKQV